VASIENIAYEIREFCLKNADKTTAEKHRRYFVEGYDPYGISQKAMNEEHKLLLLKYKPIFGFDDFLALGDLLMKSGKYEEASFALMFVTDFSREYQPATFERIGLWLDYGVRNWAHADMLAVSIFSKFLLKGIVPFTAFSEWRTAESKWKRRVVPVSLIKYVKKFGRTRELLDFLSPMMLSPEKVVHQGLGWFLREAWKLNPEPVETFLFQWKDSAPRLIFQYATEKMTADQKALFKRAK